MFITTVNTGLVCCNTYSYLISNRNGIKPYVKPPTLAKKNGISTKNSSYKANKPLSQLKFSSSKILIQSAVGIFALGFLDAGYSGDWSRIGVISREVEDLLKAAAFLVVPFFIFVIVSLSRKGREE